MKKLLVLLILAIANLLTAVDAYSQAGHTIIYKKERFPFKFGQFIDGIRSLIEIDCGKCIRYYSAYPLTPGITRGNSSESGYVAVLKLDNDGEPFISVSIACPNLTNVQGVLTLQFSFEDHSELFFKGVYESTNFSLLKTKETENIAVDMLFQKVKTFYGWDKERDERYAGYEVDFGNLYRDIFKKRSNKSSEELGMNTAPLYWEVIWVTRLISKFKCESNTYFTDINSPGYKWAVKSNLAYVTKIARDDGWEILSLNCPSPSPVLSLCENGDDLIYDCRPSYFSVNKGNLQFLFEPIHEKKILKLSKIITEDGEINPESKKLKEDLQRFIKIFDRLRFSDFW